MTMVEFMRVLGKLIRDQVVGMSCLVTVILIKGSTKMVKHMEKEPTSG